MYALSPADEKAFYYRLPKVCLTNNAIEYLDKQNKLKGAARLVIAQDEPLSKVEHEFASNGGPRLRWVQGDSDSKGIPFTKGLYPTVRAVISGEGENMVARPHYRDNTIYDANFELDLQEQGIFREFARFPNGETVPEPRNLQEINKILSERRNDEQPPGLDEENFLCFVETNMDTSHLETMRTIIPTIAGPKTQDEVSGKRFEIEPIGHIAFVQPVPDIFDCARRSELNEDICRTLRRRIIPAYRIRHPKNSDLAVPNWFVEARSLSDNTEACKRQISFEGAYGARAMHELQNYDRETGEKVCDGNAYTYSAVYVRESRCLEIFAHHMAKAAANGREQYFMTKLCEFNMTESKDSFQKGINAFRNARALAGKYRDAVIKIANNRAVMEQGRSKRRTYNMLAEVSRKEELSRLEELSRKEELSSKAEPSSLPKAALRKEGVLKRTRPDDDAVEGHEEAPSPKKVKRSQSII